jgi:heterodisulfide reductase subunit A
MNPYRLEIANIREQCAWVHPRRTEATPKAIALTKSGVEKARRTVPLSEIEIPITKRAVVIGAGIAGIQAALDIAQSGYEVHLIEKRPTIGGRMAQLSETFPSLDCSSCILTPKMVEASQHENIHIHTLAEVVALEGSVGSFRVTVRQHPRFVSLADCTGCGDCLPVCPEVGPNEFDEGLGARKAIYLSFPQAVPFCYTIDRETCLNESSGPLICDACRQVCEPKAIDFDQPPEDIAIEAGAVVVATGFDTLPLDHFAEYGYDRHPDIIDGLMFERLLSASGPTQGEIRRPSDGAVPKSIAFIECAGSRDPERGVPYCSRICCMYTAKHALLYEEAVEDAQAYVFYMDIRAGGKGHEEFIEQVRRDHGVIYVRGKVARIHAEDGKLSVWGVDTLIGEQVKIDVDMVVLATAIVPSAGVKELAQRTRLPIDENGFLSEAHPKLRPVESTTAGIYLAGVAQAPRDISDTVAQASGAASKVAALFSRDYLSRDPHIAVVDAARCRGCDFCAIACPFNAIHMDGAVAEVDPALCAGCGACVPVCFPGAIRQEGFRDEQILAQLKTLVRA